MIQKLVVTIAIIAAAAVGGYGLFVLFAFSQWMAQGSH